MSTNSEPSFPDEDHIISPAVMIRRALFLILLLGLALFYLMIDFKGLSHPLGMDQAQIAREVARGHSFTTKMIRPVALWQTNQHQIAEEEPEVAFVGFYDTYHAPLNPLFNSLLVWMGGADVEFDQEASTLYGLDVWISAGSVLLLLCSIGVSYLLVARIFDAKIAGVMAFLLLLCELLWKFAQTGLPQMLMLFLFSFALYFVYKALENVQEGKSPMLWAALAGGFFGLLALSHWITVWIFMGLILFTALYFRPRGVVAVLMFGIFAAIVSIWLVRNQTVSGDFAGVGKYVFYGGLAEQSEGTVMRNYNPQTEKLQVKGLPTKVIRTSLTQIKDIYRYLGAVIAAPLFFFALLHPFRRKEIADFRWCVLSMWVFGLIGMSVFGLADKEYDANQIHILFIPIFTGYGLAFLSILWNRLNLPMEVPFVRNGHFIIAIVISALPLLLTLPSDVIRGVKSKHRRINYPPYHPPLFKSLSSKVDQHDIIVSDVPWAIAWYGDRTSVWLPKTMEQFDELKVYAEDKSQPIAAVILTPETTGRKLASEIVSGEFAEWSVPVLRGGFNAAYGEKREGFDKFVESFQPTQSPIFPNNEIVLYFDEERLKSDAFTR